MRPLAIAAFFTALAGLGCQGASSRTPTAAPPTAPNGGPPPLATLIETGPLTAGATVMALHELVLTRAADGQVAAALEPVRAAQALGDVYNIEATTLFNTSPCGDCLKVVGLGYDGSGKVLVDLELRHPFALPPLPYTAVSRLDLHAFDVMGYVVTNGPGNPLVFGGNSVVAQPVLANADGYSDLYDGALEPYISTPGVTEHPYRVFFRDDGPGNFAGEHPNGFADLRDPQGHNTMAMGETSQVQYALTLPGGMNELRLGLAIGLSWGQGARGRGAELTQRQNPVYYLPEFHHKAAWTVTGLLTANTLTEGDPNGSATLELRLRDWQRGAAVEPGFEFAVTPRDRVTAASDLAALTVEVPGLIETPIALDPAAPDSGTGLFDDAVWTTDLHNELDAPAGTYYAWVKAVDSLAPAGDAGLDRTLGNFFTVEDFHTGALVPVVVGATTNQPPTATLGPDPAATCTCGTIRFDASGSTDPDAGALTYEWDFEIPSGDPADFVPDTSGPEPFTSHRYCGAQNTFAGVRVCDDGGLCDTVLVPVEVRVGALDPQSPWEVSPIGRIPSQDISNSLDGYNGVPHFFSAYDAGRRFAVAGDHLYVMVNSPLGDVAGPDYTYRQHLLVSADGGQTWTPG
ncbi:MAG TPA: PKD domain-containing protein, partial [bacterium]|nr:PKD domain-containing protein [bacterium]